MFPRIYHDIACPLDGYEGYSFRVLVNPTGAEKTDWALGHLGVTDCPDCAKLGTPRGKQGNGDKKHCPACASARDQLGRSAVAIYGTSKAAGFDFATVASALATFSMPDLPDELLAWLYMLPGALWAARSEDVKKKLPSFLTTGNSIPSSDKTTP
jgi:hypothetical protein